MFDARERTENIFSAIAQMEEGCLLLQSQSSPICIAYDNEISDAAYAQGILHLNPEIPEAEQVMATLWALRLQRQDDFIARGLAALEQEKELADHQDAEEKEVVVVNDTVRTPPTGRRLPPYLRIVK